MNCYQLVNNLNVLCLEVICDNLDKFTEPNLGLVHPGGCLEVTYRSKIDFRLPVIQGELLLKMLGKRDIRVSHRMFSSERGGIESVMSLFTADRTTLIDAYIFRAEHLRMTCSGPGLSVLQGHRSLRKLMLNHPKQLTMEQVLVCINKDARPRMEELHMINSPGCRCVPGILLKKFVSLHTLNVSGTNVDDTGLKVIVDSLPRLRNLDISETNNLRDISPLEHLCNTLKGLNLYNSTAPILVHVLSKLSGLTHLDISQFDVGSDKNHFPVNEFLDLCAFPDLEYLDLSGNGNINYPTLESFIYRHLSLWFLGLVNYKTQFVIMSSSGHLKVAGIASEAQILNALVAYSGRLFLYKKLFVRNILLLLRNTQQDHQPPINYVFENRVQLQTAINLALYIIEHSMDFGDRDIVLGAMAWLGMLLRKAKALRLDVHGTLKCKTLQLTRRFQLQRN